MREGARRGGAGHHEGGARSGGFGAERASVNTAKTLETGLAPIDHGLDGLERGALLVVSGPEESGRTALVLRIADEVARRGLPSVFVTHREPAQALAFRLMFGGAGVADDCSIGGDRWDVLVQSAQELVETPMSIACVDCAAGAPLLSVLRALDERRAADEPPPALLVVDDADEAPEGTFAALRPLKRWARRHGSAVVAVTRRTESLYAHGPLEPDSVVRLSRPEPNVIAMRGALGGGHGQVRARLVFSDARGWIDFGASNEAYRAAQVARHGRDPKGREESSR